MRIKHQLGGGYLLATSGAAFVLLVGLMLFPIQPDAAQAEETTSKVKLTVNPVISISLQNALNVDVLPTQDGTFSSNTAALSISTNNKTGYSLYMATSNGKNTLTSQNPSISNVISAVNGGEDGVVSAKFGNNTWGYNLSQDSVSDATAYKAVPTANGDTALITTSSPTEADTYNLTFGTKVDTSLPSGTYSNDVVVSVVANPAFVPVFDGIQTMQEMTSAICADAAENDTAQLTDTRDGKKYWVAKLKDGNCWMTQNLDLDLGVKDGNTDTTVLTPADSDVSNNWTPPRTTEPAGTITSANTDTETYSWDLGMYVKSDPDGYSNYCDDVKGLSDADCTSAGWTNVSSMTPMEDGNATDVISGSTYNAHYLVGNLYQWNAATAGTGGTIDNYANATDSICPKGWRLPTSRRGGEFDTLVGNLDSTTITQTPYYFNPSGYVVSGSLGRAGLDGYYWSSTADSRTSSAFYLYFGSGVYPSNSYLRYRGQSVRCLASQ